jgi:adenosine deaminase
VDFQALPKVELHRHLEGSIRFETFAELAKETGLDLPRAELRRRTTMKGDKPGFLRFLSKFELYRGLYPSRDWIERIAFESAEDAKRDGVIYLESRFSPTHFGRRMKAKGEDVAEWVRRGARRSGLAVDFVATFGRDFGVEGNEPTTRAVKGTDVFSGLDLAGNEAVSARPFLALFKRLKLPLTLHAGETGSVANVREAMDVFGARRIGHGLAALKDAALMKQAKDRLVHFELCPSSGLQTGAAKSWQRHPAWRFLEARVMCSLNTDDPSICGVSLSHEYRRAREHGITRDQLRNATLGALVAAFRPSPSERKPILKKILARWALTP